LVWNFPGISGCVNFIANDFNISKFSRDRKYSISQIDEAHLLIAKSWISVLVLGENETALPLKGWAGGAVKVCQIVITLATAWTTAQVALCC
jgi:hypothetical protein